MFFLLIYRSKTYVFEEFLFTWQERLRKLEQPTVMSVKLQEEVDKYKVYTSTVQVIICRIQFKSSYLKYVCMLWLSQISRKLILVLVGVYSENVTAISCYIFIYSLFKWKHDLKMYTVPSFLLVSPF